MLGNVNGLALNRQWYPRIVKEAFLQSTKDGEIKQAPDPVTMIEGDLTWFNNSNDDQVLTMQVLRAPRSITAQSPSTVVITDAWSWDIGSSPSAEFPSVNQDMMGGKMQLDRPSAAPADLLYGRFFFDHDESCAWVNLGIVAAQMSLHFRYIAGVWTPGVWTAPTEFDPLWEAEARWTRLLAFAAPVGSS